MTCAASPTFPPRDVASPTVHSTRPWNNSGAPRYVAAVVPSYAVGALMALEQDLICLVPNVTAAHLTQRGVPLRSHEVPLDLPTADVELRWHRRVNDDPASQWLRERLRDSIPPLAAIPGGP